MDKNYHFTGKSRKDSPISKDFSDLKLIPMSSKVVDKDNSSTFYSRNVLAQKKFVVRNFMQFGTFEGKKR